MSHPHSTRLSLARRIRADPASTALLLAGPAALELWPGARRVGEVAGRMLLEVSTWPAARHLTAAVAARLPRRTADGFVTRFSWTGLGLPVAEGVLTLTYVPGGTGGTGAPSAHAELVLEVAGLAASRLDLAGLTTMAEGFLANLAAAAEARRRTA